MQLTTAKSAICLRGPTDTTRRYGRLDAGSTPAGGTDEVKMENKLIGVYGIFDKDDVCLYVGQSTDIETRWKEHKKKLNNGYALENFCRWYHTGDNKKNINFRVLSVCVNDEYLLNTLEIFWFNELKPVFYGKSPSTKGKWRLSDETRKKISDTNLKKSTPLPKILCGYCRKSFTPKKRSVVFCGVSCARSSRFRHTVEDAPTKSKILELRMQGHTYREIGKIFGVSHVTIMTVFKSDTLVEKLSTD